MIVTTVSLGHLIVGIIFLIFLALVSMWFGMSYIIYTLLNLFRGTGPRTSFGDVFFMRRSKLK